MIRRRDECMVLRPDLLGVVPDGLVPAWARTLPVAEAIEAVRLRRVGFELLGLRPDEDPDDLFADEDD